MKLRFNLIGCLLVLCINVMASSFDEERVLLEKRFDVEAEVSVSVKNSYGDIKVIPTDKRGVYVRVVMQAKGKSETKIDQLANDVAISVGSSSSEISLVTQNEVLLVRNGGEHFRINYYVEVNRNQPLSLYNKYGDVLVIGDYNGEVEFDLNYGNIKAGRFAKTLQGSVAFGNVVIQEVGGGQVNLKYSDMVLKKAAELEIDQRFSTVNLGAVGKLMAQAKYGELAIASLISGEVEAHFSAFELGRLDRSLVFEGNYVTKFNIDWIGKDAELIDLSGQYSTFRMTMSPELSMEIEAELSYCDIVSEVNITYTYQDKSGVRRKEYQGYFGDQSAKGQLKISSSYGDLRIYQ